MEPGGVLTEWLGPMAGPALGLLAYLVAKILDHLASKARNNATYFQVEREALDRSTKALIQGLENRVKGQAADLAAARAREDGYTQANQELREENIRFQREMDDLRQRNAQMEEKIRAMSEHIASIEECIALRREERLEP